MGIFNQLRHGYLDLGRGKETVIVAGSGRSGTTWLGDVVAKATGSRIIFEPFLVDNERDFALTKVKQRSMANVLQDYSLYLSTKSHVDDRYRRQVMGILSGTVCSHWSEQQSKKGIFFRRLVKDIRMNMLLGYIKQQWPDILIIYVIRDPIKVIESQFKKSRIGWEFGWKSEYINSQPSLIDEKLNDYCRFQLKGTDLVSNLVNRWCVENIVAISDLKNSGNGLIVSYEDLTRLGKDWCRVEKFLKDRGWPFHMDTQSINIPSFTSDFTKNDKKLVRITNGVEQHLTKVIEMYDLSKWVQMHTL